MGEESQRRRNEGKTTIKRAFGTFLPIFEMWKI
jgi:hypothetical protein